MFVLLMFSKDLARPFRDGHWNPGETRHFDAIASVSRPGFNGSQKDDAIARFLDGDMEVSDAGKQIRKFRKLMIVRGKDRLCLDLCLNVLDDSPRQGQSVECGCPSADFIQDDQASGSR